MIKHELKSSTLYLCTHLFTKSQLTIKSTKILFVCVRLWRKMQLNKYTALLNSFFFFFFN